MRYMYVSIQNNVTFKTIEQPPIIFPLWRVISWGRGGGGACRNMSGSKFCLVGSVSHDHSQTEHKHKTT